MSTEIMSDDVVYQDVDDISTSDIPTTTTNTPKEYITVDEFKRRLGVSEIIVVRNPNTLKLFVDANGTSFKCKQLFDSKLPAKWMYEKGQSYLTGCLVNVPDSKNIIAKF